MLLLVSAFISLLTREFDDALSITMVTKLNNLFIYFYEL